MRNDAWLLCYTTLEACEDRPRSRSIEPLRLPRVLTSRRCSPTDLHDTDLHDAVHPIATAAHLPRRHNDRPHTQAATKPEPRSRRRCPARPPLDRQTPSPGALNRTYASQRLKTSGWPIHCCNPWEAWLSTVTGQSPPGKRQLLQAAWKFPAPSTSSGTTEPHVKLENASASRRRAWCIRNSMRIRRLRTGMAFPSNSPATESLRYSRATAPRRKSRALPPGGFTATCNPAASPGKSW